MKEAYQRKEFSDGGGWERLELDKKKKSIGAF